MNQYSLTEMTTLFEHHYFSQLEKIKNNKDILNYNNHKIRHTYGVLFTAQRIMTYEKKIFDNEHIIKKAEISSLLHDIGRFYQNNGERILSWSEFEHGEFWYDILKKEWITDLSILFGVKYHNKKDIDWIFDEEDFIKLKDIEKEEVLNVLKLVRDADKLQNLEYILFNFNDRLFWLDKIDNSYTDIVLEQFLNKVCVDRKYKKTYIDNILLLAWWIFDLNFQTSNNFLKNDKFIDFIVLKLEEVSLDKDIILKIKATLEEYLK